ncbi:MAG: isoamylase early set domain-containing protein [Desulfobacterales bacterium]
MSIKKQYLKSRPVCKVTFKIPENLANSAQSAHVVGDFNNWSISEHPMKRQKNGAFSMTIDLEKGREYQFRYLLDSEVWENDPEADRYVPTPFGNSDNSVLIL